MDPTIAAAIRAAWPSDDRGDTLARLRRLVAFELAKTQYGPLGAHSCLSAKLSSTVRSLDPALATEAVKLCSPPDGTLRLKQLIARAPGMPGPPSHGTEDPAGPTFLYWRPYPSDACIILDVAALLNWHSGGSNFTPTTPPNGPGYGVGAPRPGFPHRVMLLSGTGYSRTTAGVNIDLSGVVTRYGNRAGGVQDGSSARAEGPPDANGANGQGAVGSEEWKRGSGLTKLVNLSYMAFPGTSPASQLRRSLVGCLAAAIGETEAGGLPRYTVPWRQIATMVAGSRAASLLPTLTTPAVFKTFLLHPASFGVFAATRILRDRSNPASSVDCVSLNEDALAHAAPLGISAAVSAAWPGQQQLQQLKRTAAEILARAWSPAGSYTLNSGPMGNEMKRRRPTLYESVKGGLMPQLDESGKGGFLAYVREHGKEGYLQLKLHALLRAYPVDNGCDLGLGETSGLVTTTTTQAAGETADRFGAISQGHLSTENSQGDLVSPTGASTSAAAAVYMTAFSSEQPGYGSDPATEAAAKTSDSITIDTEVQYGSFDVAPLVHAVTASPAPQPSSYEPAFGAAVAADGSSAALGAADPAALQVVHASPSPAMLMEPTVQYVSQSVDFDAMLQRCYSGTAIGLAVHTTNGKPVMAAVYVAACTTTDPAAAGIDSSDATRHAVTWPPLVYVFDCALVTLGGSGDAGGEVAPAGQLPGAPEAFRMLIESPYVSKVAHGSEQVAGLALICGATTISPILDTRVVLTAVSSMLPPPPPLPPRPPAYAAVGPLAAVTLAKLNSHISSWRDEFVKTGIWSERPDLLNALVARHTAALREDLFGVRDWSSNVPMNEANLVAAARYLPELWDALVHEAVPWVAMAAAADATATALNTAPASHTNQYSV